MSKIQQKNELEIVEREILAKISKSIREKIGQTLSWLDTAEGQVFTKSLSIVTPFIIGNPIGFLLPFVIESADIMIRKRFLNHFPDLANKLQKNQDKINLKFVHTEIGQKLLRDTIQNMIHETNEEKIKHLKSFLVNAYSKDSDEEIIQNCQKILLNMEPIHIKLLSIFRKPEEVLRSVAKQREQKPRAEKERPHGKHDCVVFWKPEYDDINQFYLKTNHILYKNGLKDLVTWNILETVFHESWLYFDHTFEENFQSVLRDIDRWTTPFGKQFLNFIYDE